MNPSITVVSLGPGDPDLVNPKTIRTLENAACLILLTGKHRMSQWLSGRGIPFSTLDGFFEEAADFEELRNMISAHLWDKARISSLVYAVPDASSDLSVRTLYRTMPASGIITVIPGTGYSDVFLSSSLSSLCESDLRILPAYELLTKIPDPDTSLLVVELDNALLAGQVKCLLSDYLEDEKEVVFLQGEKAPRFIPLYELDRQHGYDHQSAVLIPASVSLQRSRFLFNDLVHIMDRLRSPGGCPWDREQTHTSLRPYLIEEAWECVAAIDQNDMDHLSEELGDLLFQIVFHASIGSSFDEFTLVDVISSICRKMIRRHPHVFAGSSFSDHEALRISWETIKREETGRQTVPESLEDVSEALPSLKYAEKMLKKISQIPSAKRTPDMILPQLAETVRFLEQPGRSAQPADLEELLLLCSELCFSLRQDGELLLHHAVDHMKSRIMEAEKKAVSQRKTIESLTFNELGVYLSHVEGEIE